MNKKQFFYSNLLAWGIVLLLVCNYVFGWTTPTEDPPGGNIVLETGAKPAGSTGYIQFNDAGNLGADSNLFWDNTNKRLGIGTTAPNTALEIAGGGNILQTITAPAYQGGADASGSTNSGTGSKTFNSVSVSGRYAYVVTAGNSTECSTDKIGCELQIYDISVPAAPTYVGGADASGSTNSGTGNKTFNSVSVSGRYVYVGTAGSSTACSATPNAIGCELMVFDISNPAAPTYVGGADASGSTNSETGFKIFYSVSVSGRYAYVATANNTTACSATPNALGCELMVFDISNPAAPIYVGGADASGSTNSGTGNKVFYSVFVSGRYAYVGTWGDATACSATPDAIGCELMVFDISNPAAPTYVGGADASGSTNSGTGSKVFNSVFVSGRYAYAGTVGHTTACSATPNAIGCELMVFDISNPAAPTYVGGADASGLTNSGTGAKAFNSVSVSGRYAYVVTGGSAGTCSATPGDAFGCESMVFDITGIEAGSAMIHSLEAGNLQVRNDIILQGQLQVTGGVNIGQGGLFSSGPLSIYDQSYFSGNVGIGTTSPGAKLEVSGDIKLSGASPTYRITNLAEPANDSDVATKKYVDNFTCGDNVNFVYNGKRVTYGTIFNSTTGKCWMDRNLGALRVATAYNDASAYGDLFQWGRLDDGHQRRTSGTTTTLSSTDDPGHSNFIRASASPFDWLSTRNNNLWQGVSGFNNPCPSGWRIPTRAECDDERLSWSEQNYNGAFGSPLKLPAGGYRQYSDGVIAGAASYGFIWSLNTSSASAYFLSFTVSAAYTGLDYRARGISVRCVKD